MSKHIEVQFYWKVLKEDGTLQDPSHDNDVPHRCNPNHENGGYGGYDSERDAERHLERYFDEVDWQIDNHFELLARDLPPQVAEVIYSAVREGLRNAARHGRGERN